MKEVALRMLTLSVLLTAGFILVDLIVDRLLGDVEWLGWPRFILMAAVLLVSYALLIRAAVAQRRAEAMLSQARADLEAGVQERTGELAQANEQLRGEIIERRRVEQALRTSEETV